MGCHVPDVTAVDCIAVAVGDKWGLEVHGCVTELSDQ
jgi:hypothetical protein